MIKVEQIYGSYGNQPLINGVSFEVEKGKFFALVGPNGSGKSTILKLISGILPLKSGHVYLQNQELSSLTIAQRAQMMAVLGQEQQVSFNYSVEEVVQLSRYVYQKGLLKHLSKNDLQVVEQAMEITKVVAFKEKPFHTLSGGEKQRVLLAKALAQEPKILLLDEPTNHLDIQHTFELLTFIKEWQRDKQITVFGILHDLNIAALYADQLALLQEGQILAQGDAQLFRRQELIDQLYGIDMYAAPHPTRAEPQLMYLPLHPSDDPGVYGELKLKEEERERSFFDQLDIIEKEDQLSIHFPCYIKSISNGRIGDGVGWNRSFNIIEKVDKLTASSSTLQETVVLERDAHLLYTNIVRRNIEQTEIFIVLQIDQQLQLYLMLFVDQMVSEGELIQLLLVATEAKQEAKQVAKKEGRKESLEEGNEPLVKGKDRIVIGATHSSLTSNQLSAKLEQQIYQEVLEMLEAAFQESIVRLKGLEVQ